VLNHYFAERMLSGIKKLEKVECIRKMRVATSLSKDSRTQKRKALIEVSPTQSDEDEHTNSGLVFKRKRREVVPLTEHSNSDGRAPHQEFVNIQECEVESSHMKSLWDAGFDALAHNRPPFLFLKIKLDYLLKVKISFVTIL